MLSDSATASRLSTACRRTRAVARRLGLGRARARLTDRVAASTLWSAVPARRIKDLDPTNAAPRNAIALTFDDGPDPDVTPALLRVLDANSAFATFFMCGLAARRHPDIVRAVLDAGHSIGGHSWDHTRKIDSGLSPADWSRQVDDTHAALEDLAGAPVVWFRPPRGMTDRPTWRRLGDCGVTTVLWSVDAADCSLRDPEGIAHHVLRVLRAGDIVLLHDANGHYLRAPDRPAPGAPGNQMSTVRATDLILRDARQRGLNPISLDMLPAHQLPRAGRPRRYLRYGRS